MPGRPDCRAPRTRATPMGGAAQTGGTAPPSLARLAGEPRPTGGATSPSSRTPEWLISQT